MKRLISGFLLAAFLAAPAYAADTYKLDPNHTNIFWHADHFGFSKPSGKFTDVTGTLILDEAKPENSSVKMDLKTRSLVTGIPKFDEHLKSKDFFDVKKYPKIVFESRKVEVTGKDTAKVSGTLTIRDIAKPVVLDVKLNKIGEQPMTKEKVAGFSARTKIKRSDYGMTYAIPGVADEVEITIETEANIVAGKNP